MRHNLKNLSRMAVLIILGSAPLAAQGVQTGDLAGTITSSAGEPVVGALVRLDSGRGVFNSRTDSKGGYRFPLQIVGNSKLLISAQGYIGAHASVYISLGKTTVLNVTLKPAKEAAATVEVTASSEQLDVTAVTDGKNTSMDFVNDLPINNRSIQSIASLTPGTSSDANGLTIRGAQSVQTQYLVDGVDVMDPVTGGASIFMNEDMIEDIQVVTGGATADLGRFTGGMVNTVTKSGTNEFEGLARWEMTNPKWNAYAPLQHTDLFAFQNHVSTTQTYRYSGPLWKDHLFFVVGYRTISPEQLTPSSTTADPAYGGGVSYNRTLTDERKDIKIDYQITPDHRVFWQYNQTDRNRTGIDYSDSFFGGSTSTDTLSSQKDHFSYTSLGYVGTFGNNLVLNAHYGYKKEQLGGPQSGGQGGLGVPTMIDNQTGYVFDNGVFGNDPDVRPVKNATVSLTWFAHSPIGEHEIKVGYDWFESRHNAANSQSPTNWFIYFNGFQPNFTSTAISNRIFDTNNQDTTYLQVWQPFVGAVSKNTIDSIYLNDKWKLDKNWAFNLGVRYDKFKSANDLQANNFDVNYTSPRFTAIYDINGDATWVTEVSYDIYAGQVIQGATDNATVVGNPAEYEYVYTGGNPTQRASWSSTPFYVFNPQLYRHSNQIDPNLKMPVVTEKAITVRHNDSKGGTYSVTVTQREWKKFTTTFSDLQYHPADENDYLYNYITNDPLLVRHYLGIEFQWSKKITESFGWGGNVTFSELKGNFEGGQVGTTSQLHAYGPLGLFPTHYENVQPAPPADPVPPTQLSANQPTVNELSPYGFLAADRPITANVWANWTVHLGRGRLNIGGFATYNSGAPYSNTATASLRNYPVQNPGAFTSTYTRYFTARGSLRFPDQYNTNLQVGYDQPVWRKVAVFGRLNITNLFNHQLLTSWNTTGSSYAVDPNFYTPDPTGTITGPSGARYSENATYGQFIRDPWNSPSAQFVAGSRYGQPTSSSNYLTARALNFAIGLRF